MRAVISDFGAHRFVAALLLGALANGVALGQDCDVRYLESPQPDARSSYAMAYDNVRQGVFLFGGVNTVNGRGTFGDFWRRRDGCWSAVAQGATRPTPRRFAGMTFDRDQGRLFLFGGLSELGVTLNDVWEWDGEAWTDQTPVSPFPAPARRRVAIAYDEVRHQIVVFGGASGSGANAETRVWEGDHWRLVATGPISPRQGAAMAFDAREGVIVLFGGLFGSAGYTNDTWKWDGVNWILQNTGSNTPPGRHGHALSFDRVRHTTVLFGGMGVGNTPLPDTWEFDGTEWNQGPPSEVPARAFISSAYDEQAGKTIMFGGYSNVNTDTYFSGTWYWDGTRWENPTLRRVPPHRVYPAVAYDSARGVTVIVGGRGNSGLLSDTWEWNGMAWSLKSAPAGQRPGIVERAAMTFDSRRNVAVHFGGQNDTLLSGETWEWDGISAQWSLKSQQGPSPRRAHAMAFDPLRQYAVLFGGEDASGRRNDTWLWNGLAWSAVPTPPDGPAPRVHAAMAFDESRGSVVMVGGFADGIGYTNDAWEWTGSGWSPIIISGTLPPPRDEHGLVYDTARNRLMLIAGLVGDNQPSNDAWELLGNTWSPMGDAPPTPRFGAGFVFDALRAQAMMIAGADSDRLLDQVWFLRTEVPDITENPAPVRVPRANSFELRGSAQFDSSFTYTWRRNAVPLADNARVSGSHTPVLRVEPSTLDDSGVYDLVAAGPCGGPRTLPARVVVYCPADVDDGSGIGNPDGGVTIEDLLYYLGIYELGVPAADIDDGTGTGTRDDGVTIEDLLYFLQRYEGGC